MATRYRLRSLWRNLFRRRHVEQDLDAEVRSFVELRAAEHVAAGMPSQEARRRALIEAGGIEQVKEEVRAVRAGALLEQFLQDLAFGARMLRKKPGFAVVTVLTIALGIGVNTAIFALFDFAALRPLDVPQSGRLVSIYQNFRGEWGRNVHGTSSYLSYPEYLEYRDQNHVLSGALAYAPFIQATAAGYDKQLLGQLVSCNYFQVLEAPLALGRGFNDEECRAKGMSPVVVLSNELWRNAFGADPAILGRVIRINRQALTVVGVAAPQFHGIEIVPSTFWAPLTMQRAVMGDATGSLQDLLAEDNLSWLVVIGRLRDGVSLAEARADLRLIAAHIDQRHPKRITDLTVNTATLLGAPDQKMSLLAVTTVVLLATGMVLLIGCANITNLMLERAVQRRREIAVRLAVGAARGRIVRQLLTESLQLALVGAALGVAVAGWCSAALVQFVFNHVPPEIRELTGVMQFSLHFDWRMFAYTAALAVVTCLLCGLAPALQATRTDVNRELKLEGSEFQSAGGRKFRLRSALLGTQVAVCLVLLISAGLLLRALVRAQTLDIGIEPNRIGVISYDLAGAGYTETTAAPFQHAVRERLRTLPAVDAVAEAVVLPLSGGRRQSPFATAGHTDFRIADYNAVSPGYFALAGIPLVRGRDFTEADMNSDAAVIINESMARRLWPGEDPLGKRLQMQGAKTVSNIVGLVRDTEFVRPGESHIPIVFLPLQPRDELRGKVLLRARGDVNGLRAAAIAAVHQSDPALLTRFARLEDNLQNFTGVSQIAAGLASSLGSLGLVLAVIGIYGTVAFTVSQRTREIGIRMTLGARAGDVLRLVLRQTMRPALVGVVAGIAACAAISRLLKQVLFGISSLDALTFGGVSAGLLAIAFLASYVPARRALRIDPMAALRHE